MHPVQTYANHRRRFTASYLLAGLSIAASIATFALDVSRTRALGPLAGLLLSIGCGCLWFSMRMSDLKLQDRIIRDEMRARFEAVLGPAGRADFARLSSRQLVALRFASDAELAVLVADALTGLEPDAIKRKIRDWQPDHVRV